MNNAKILLALAVVSVFYCCNCGAATLSFSPVSTTVAQGSDFFVDIVISELGDGTAPSLGDFEVNIDFNPLSLALVSVTLGTELGDVGLGEALDVSFGLTMDGSLNIAMVSLLTDAELDVQPDSFVLATLQFTAVFLLPGNSTSIVFATPRVLGDALGDAIPITGITDTLIFGAAPIPLPATIWLFASAVGLLSLTRSKR